MPTRTHPGRWLPLCAAAAFVLDLAGAASVASASESDEANSGNGTSETFQTAPPLPRRPPRLRADGEVSFPPPILPETTRRQEREETGALDAFLGPIPKEVVVAEGTSFEAMQRVAAIENTRLGLATVGGNTLTPEDVRSLSLLPAVHLHLTAPVKAVHVEVVERIPSLRAVTVRVPEGLAPEESLGWRLARLGATRRNVILEGAPSPARLASLTGLSSGHLTIVLPEEGLARNSVDLLALRSGGLSVIVPAETSPNALESLSALTIESLILETEGNLLREEVLQAATTLDARIVVRVDGRLTREDLRRLKGVPRLELQVWLADAPGVPTTLTDLLAESEGRRPAPLPAKEE